MRNAEVIEPGKLPNTGKVIFGAVVELEDQDSGERVTYQVVGEDEADIRAGRISITSPIARALVGKSAGRGGGRRRPRRHALLRDPGGPLRVKRAFRYPG